MVKTDNQYLKQIAENTAGGGGGGGRPYDDTELRNRIITLENGKQNNLTAGSRITISSNTINTIDFIVDSINSATTTWSSNKIKGLFDSLSGKIEVRIVAEKPANPVNSTMYYVGSTAPYDIWFYVNDEYTYFGSTDIDLSDYYTETEVDNLLDNKVDKVTGKSLVLDTDIAQITTNKNNIAILDSGKVDKEAGKSLVSDTDIAQITTNKTNIATNTENIATNTGDIATLKTDKQDKITDSTLSSISDSTTVSSVSATDKTNKTFALSKVWTWITGKLSTAISSSSTDTQIPSAKAVYTNAIKPTNKTGNDALVISNNNGLTNGADYAANVIRRIIVVGKIAYFTCHLKYTSSAVGANWTEIGVVPDGLRPANRMSVVGMVYNNGLNESVGGNINTTGAISLWTNSKTAGNNYQVRIFACWEIA